MGLKITNYPNDKIGVTLPTAYAQINNIQIDMNGNAQATFYIQKDRESISTEEPIEKIEYPCKIEKDLPLYEQIYVKAKENIFVDWEDDIVE